MDWTSPVDEVEVPCREAGLRPDVPSGEDREISGCLQGWHGPSFPTFGKQARKTAEQSARQSAGSAITHELRARRADSRRAPSRCAGCALP